MAPRRARESKQGLVIALVFAVLVIIGLGVTAYYGFNGQEALRSDSKKNKNEAADFKDQRDWYKFQSQLYRAYMGQTEGIDFADLSTTRGQFETGSLGKNATDKEGVTKLIKETLDRKLAWDNTQNRPKQSYEGLLQQEKERTDNFEKRTAAAEAAKEAAEKATKKASDELKAERAAFDDKLLKLTKQTEVDMSGYLQRIKAQQEEITRLGEANEQIRKTASDDKKRADEALASSSNSIKGLLAQLDAKKQMIEEIRNKGVDIAPKGWQTDWKIVSIDRTGQSPFINLGSADHVQPQLTFSIHAQGPDGRPVSSSKGSLEVVSVLGEHLSQARMLTVKDRNKEPILKGDILFNPSWSPTLKKHVALTGVIDLTGDGRDNTYEVIRNLEKQNIVVDAYVDPRDSTIKGKGITVQTDYLIDGGAFPEPVGEGDQRLKEMLRKKEEESGKLKKAAKENGVQVVSLRQYLEMIGYRLPRTAAELGVSEGQTSSQAAETTEPVGGSKKGDEKPPADDKPADKPGDDKPK